MNNLALLFSISIIEPESIKLQDTSHTLHQRSSGIQPKTLSSSI